MLHYITLIVPLVGAAVCQDFENKSLHPLPASGSNLVWQPHTVEAWKPMETVGKAGGCCMPDKMESNVGLMLGFVDKGKPSIVVGSFKLSMDAKRGKAYMDGYFNGMPKKVWEDYATLTQYTVIPNGKGGEICTKSKAVRQPWFSQCIPAGTKKLGGVYFGNKHSPNKLDATWYLYTEKKNVAYISFTSTSRKNECIPVTESVYGKVKGVDYIVSMDFMDNVPTIKNPEVFKLPAICKKRDIPEVPVDAFMGSILFR